MISVSRIFNWKNKTSLYNFSKTNSTLKRTNKYIRTLGKNNKWNVNQNILHINIFIRKL